MRRYPGIVGYEPSTFVELRCGTVDDDAVIEAMRLLWERLKLVVEPSGAIGFAAVLRNRERFAGRSIGIVISGGNMDLDTLPWQARA